MDKRTNHGEYIRIRGAKVHNLKNVDVDIPRNKLTVITGLSGSGKSSLAFDTIYAEGERRFVESLSSYARQFLGVKEKPEVDSIEGLSPAISIDQKSVSRNPRSTVGTITEVYDYLRLLFARAGRPHCPNCGKPVEKQSVSQIVAKVLALPEKTDIAVLAPVVRDKKGEHKGVLKRILEGRYVRVRVDGTIMRVDEAVAGDLDPKKKHSIEIAIDRLAIEPDIDKARLADSLEQALKLGDGMVIVQAQRYASTEVPKYQSTSNHQEVHPDDSMHTGTQAPRRSSTSENLIFSERFACSTCDTNLPEIEPRLFSFNSPHGACPSCTGLGIKLEVHPDLVVPNPRLTIAEGAIRPWASASHRVGRQGWYEYMLTELARKMRFSLNTPVKDLPKRIVDLLLYGDRGEGNEKGFEGVIPNLERRYRESESDYTKAEIEQYMIEKICEMCEGRRLKKEALGVLFLGQNIHEIISLTSADAMRFFGTIAADLSIRMAPGSAIKTPASPSAKHSAQMLTKSEIQIITPLIKEILTRLQFLVDVGLDYLTLNRSAKTLAGGEAQRIRLATQIGSQLVGVLYILDEPSIGLHPRDHDRLIHSIKKLRDLGNTVIVVEHDRETILEADWVVDVGPGAGRHGGEIVASGTPAAMKRCHTLTGDYLSGRKQIEEPKSFRKGNGKKLIVEGAAEHNLKNITVAFPLGKLVSVTGVSGSGKSTLVIDILARALSQKFYHAKQPPGRHKDIEGLEHIDKMVHVDQSPIGRTPRSNPATYIGAFTHIRDLFAKTEEARIRGYQAGRFSFNVKGGRCEVCRGEGVRKIEMHFLPDMHVECEECHGKRYNREALEILYKEKNIFDVLDMTVEEALKFFEAIPPLKQKLKTLLDVGLSYIKVGQPATTLSGGEAQRVKLANELARRDTGRTLYILDEPTTGLHFDDVRKLLGVLQKLVDKGNTVLVIEHNLDVIKCADWVIDLGPDGGSGGGEIIAEGTPKDIMKAKRSYTGQWLKKQES
ncbi:MAG: excinuclease ABC subunit UvrA [bacterium]|nr:excinuclease ABC subunit UvrA [bacterium]